MNGRINGAGSGAHMPQDEQGGYIPSTQQSQQASAYSFGEGRAALSRVDLRISVGDLMKIAGAVATALGTLLSGAIAGGYLYKPAREADLKALGASMVEIRQELGTLSSSVDGLRRSLGGVVERWDANPPVRRNLRPAAPVPSEGTTGEAD